MDRIELWFWELKDELTGEWRRTRYRIPRRMRGPGTATTAHKIEDTLEVRGGDQHGLNIGVRIMENLPPRG
jgi:hypothetical protein